MGINWPISLVEELADRRCILVMGAGASADCVGLGGARPPLWDSFLQDAITALISDPAAASTANDLLAHRRYLDAAEVIIEASNAADFQNFVRTTFVKPKFRPGQIHELILELDPKVVVTTNYDEIYDHYCREGNAKLGYVICKYYEDQALNVLRSPTRLVLKAHGCVSNADKIVLSRSQYFDARNKHVQFYNIVDGLFLLNTALFIGCSLNDPDLQLILENVNISARSTHTHYAVVEAGMPAAVRSSFRRTYNVELLEYESGKHEQVAEGLRDLRDQVISLRQHPA